MKENCTFNIFVVEAEKKRVVTHTGPVFCKENKTATKTKIVYFLSLNLQKKNRINWKEKKEKLIINKLIKFIKSQASVFILQSGRSIGQLFCR